MFSKKPSREDTNKVPSVRIVVEGHEAGEGPQNDENVVPKTDDSTNKPKTLDEASTMTLLGSIGEFEDSHHDNLPAELQVLRHLVEILFLTPEKDVLDPSVMYDMRSGDDQRLFYIVRKPPAKFHGRCDVHMVDRDTEQTYLRLTSSKLNPYKLMIKQGTKPIGVISQTNWILCLPRFIIRDSFRNEVAIIRTKRKDPVTGKRLPKEAKLGTIGRIDHEEDEEEIVGGLLGIYFEDDGLDVQERCLLVAATLFLDFNLFGNMKPTSPYYILFGMLFFILMITLAVIGFIKL